MKLFTQASYALVLSVALTGCFAGGNTNTKPLNDLMADSNAALTAGKTDKAIETLNLAAKENPTSAQPWLKQAQIHFDNGNYPAAIQASDEAMKRDSTNRDAKAIAVVASLRVAVQALNDMNKDSTLRGSKRSEAERLAYALRETLNQDVLVPLDTKAKPASTPSAATTQQSAAQPAARTAAKPHNGKPLKLTDAPKASETAGAATPAAAAPAAASNNPWSALTR